MNNKFQLSPSKGKNRNLSIPFYHSIYLTTNAAKTDLHRLPYPHTCRTWSIHGGTFNYPSRRSSKLNQYTLQTNRIAFWSSSFVVFNHFKQFILCPENSPPIDPLLAIKDNLKWSPFVFGKQMCDALILSIWLDISTKLHKYVCAGGWEDVEHICVVCLHRCLCSDVCLCCTTWNEQFQFVQCLLNERRT